ncbi:MFS transporter [Kutzneria sp. CA-103260]|uniref:MFS transporter n=1 Tax=Kutzneria sp. CA-103260 TaxID=2802641 RepID=UPI001BA4F9C4|nr:MFS transporter [Kutzneria sp. CA-103260]QUQ66512.1 integral membrane efflux protein [Kutzneria sp. CA-103260]
MREGRWNRDFSLFFVARAAARLGDMMLPVALAAGLIQYGYGVGAVGVAMAANSACFAGFVIFGGVIADRFDTRTVMVCADLTRVVTQSLVAVMFFTGHVVFWQVCVIGAVNGLCAALFQPGIASTIPRIATDVQGANGLIRIAESVMGVAGPAFAGVLIGVTSVGGVFAAHAATYLTSALCLLGLRLRRGPRPARRERFRADLVEGWREFRSRGWVWGVILVWMVLMITTFGPLTPLAATEIITSHGDAAYGLVNSIGGVGMAVGGLIAMRLRPRHPLRAGAIAMLAYGIQPITVALHAPIWLIAAGCAVTGGVQTFWSVMWATSIQTQIPGSILNRIHAYEVAGSLAMMPVGQALAGPAAGVIGSGPVLVVGAVTAVAGMAALLLARPVRDLGRAEPEPAGVRVLVAPTEG